MERGVPIRSLSRGLAVLSTINRDGPITMTNISRSEELPYPTACRIVQTLIHEGLVEREHNRKRYRVTSLVETLSTGFQQEGKLVEVAHPHITSLCQDVGWPVSVATRVGTRMVLRDSTHAMTSMTFSNYHPGYTLPIAECATGRVYLAFCDDLERETVIKGWQVTDNETSRFGEHLVEEGHLIEKIREEGYAILIRNEHNADHGKTSAIGLPILGQDGTLLGCLGMIYFDTALSTKAVVDQFLSKLKKTAQVIGRDLSQ
ncbi:MAG: IclR family transcriptional regulator C-terminal domain-containing protein [Erythrobacter sp.]